MTTQLSADNFGEDLEFLQKHTEVILLEDASSGAKVIVAPAWQGRVMTSTADGTEGDSFGWVNRELIASGEIQPHINVYGGEDRFWLGPEGGQFSIFFEKEVPFDLEHWFTPPCLDTEPFEVISKSTDQVLCKRTVQLKNYTGTTFDLELGREVKLLSLESVFEELKMALPSGVKGVAYESLNEVKNVGEKAWTKQTGLLSVWILGMYNASEESTVVIPFEKGLETERGQIVNDNYFGKVPEDRLVVNEEVMFFRADAQFRSKIGLGPKRAKPLLGSYDAANETLTLVQFSLPKDNTDYVNSMWELQEDPFCGDTVNSYNDDGNLGKFYELESSSPALALQPNEAAIHKHRTLHLQGDRSSLDAIARELLGVSLDEITSAFGQ